MCSEFGDRDPGLTDEDFVLADEIMDALVDNPSQAIKLWVRAKPEVKKMLGGFDPRDLLIQTDPEIDSDKVFQYIAARDKKDEVGTRRIYASCNDKTRKEIDDLIKP